MHKDITKKFQRARKLFPHTNDIIYLNSASYGPFSTPLVNAINGNMKIRMEADKDDSHDAFKLRIDLRKRYAKLIGAKQSDVGVSMNTTQGLNIAAFGLPLKKNDEILISDIEFPAMVYTFKAAAQERGLKIKFLKSRNRCFDIEAVEKAITKRTKVLAVSFVQFFNGYKNDLRVLSEICQKHDLYFVVDGIQGMGVEPINVKKLKIDVFSTGCQKWMLSPQGCGFFYLSEKIRPQLQISFMSWMGVDWNMQFGNLFQYDKPYFETAEKFELGYYAVLNLYGMAASLDIFESLTIKNIQTHNYELIDSLAEYLTTSDKYRITSSQDKKHRSSIITFTTDNIADLKLFLDEKKIMVSLREGSIRVSIHLYNNRSDIAKLIQALKQFAVNYKD